MTSALSCAKLCQPMPCFFLYSKGKVACYSTYLLTSYFCIPVPYNEKDIFLLLLLRGGGVSSRMSCRSSQNHSTSASSALLVGGIDLDYCDTEWFHLKINRALSVIEISSRYCILDSLLTLRVTPFLLRDSCLQQQIYWYLN